MTVDMGRYFPAKMRWNPTDLALTETMLQSVGSQVANHMAISGVTGEQIDRWTDERYLPAMKVVTAQMAIDESGAVNNLEMLLVGLSIVNTALEGISSVIHKNLGDRSGVEVA